ncbi:MAG: hypothetical protein ACE5R6_21060 [Candidatus Heimdallarchaeota archaeon]
MPMVRPSQSITIIDPTFFAAKSCAASQIGASKLIWTTSRVITSDTGTSALISSKDIPTFLYNGFLVLVFR